MAASKDARDVARVGKPKLGTTKLLFRSARQMGLNPSWVIPDGLFAITHNGKEHYVNAGRSLLNTHTSASIATNKYLTRRILERNQMPNIPFTHPHSHADAVTFLATHKKIVAKPLNGSGARDIHIITASPELETLNIREYILEKYIAGQELRYLVLNEKVIGVHRSDYGVSVQEDRPLKRISYPSTQWSPALVSSAVQVARVLGLRFAAVDYLIDASGHAYILEVNTNPGFKWFHAPTSGPVVNVARQFLEATFTAQENGAVTIKTGAEES